MEHKLESDYSTWTHAELVKRVSVLEALLRAQNLSYSKPASPIPSSPKKKQKTPKRFDASKYSTRPIAIKFAYLGKRYNGFEHHSNNETPLPTIEEELWKALMKTRLILPDFKGGREHEVCWEGCDYSKCGRTDRGVSAFGQVIGLRVRSSRPMQKQMQEEDLGSEVDSPMPDAAPDAETQMAWNPIQDELPYIQLLNRVLPPDIRILAWCANPPENFSARFNCKERRYRYFFTNPAYAPMPGENRAGGSGGAWLNIEAMHLAAKKLEGLHDFRNLCKVDPSKQISDFRRRIFHASVQRVGPDQDGGAFLQRQPFIEPTVSLNSEAVGTRQPELYYFEVRGSAFLWHQVRHMVAILFLVGQGYENPSIVDDLLDIQRTPAKPIYDMAADTPLVLWDCIFPEPSEIGRDDHDQKISAGYEDAVDWLHVGDTAQYSAGTTRLSTGTEDRKHGRMSIMEDLWAMWQTRKMDELLAASLMDVVAQQGRRVTTSGTVEVAERSSRVFDGSDTPRSVGPYVPIMQRERHDTPDVVNARYAARKGLRPKPGLNGNATEADE
jgi:tRNA pseudouridine38/39 synthase